MQYIYGLFSAFITMMLAWGSLIYFQLDRPTLMSQWVYDAYEKKIAIAEQINEPKIVIVAGSTALFGIDSAMLEEHFHMPVVNLGVNAGILLPLTLHAAKTVLKGGDIALLPLEYPMYLYNGTPNVQVIDYIYARSPEFFWHLTLSEQLSILWETTVNRLNEGYLARGGVPIAYGLYGAHKYRCVRRSDTD